MRGVARRVREPRRYGDGRAQCDGDGARRQFIRTHARAERTAGEPDADIRIGAASVRIGG